MVRVRLLRRSSRPADVAALLVNPADARRLRVKDGASVEVDVGRWTGRFRVSVRQEHAPTLMLNRLSPRLPVQSVALHAVGEGRLRVGPLMGIMTIYRSGAYGPHGAQIPTYLEVIKRATEIGLFAFVFRPSHVDTVGGRVFGWTYQAGRWVRCRVPLPNVVYNRLASRPAERRALPLMRRLSQLGITVFNPHYLNKWSVHRALVREPQVRRYLPETRTFRTVRDASILLAKYGRIFLKPSGGSLGLGAMQVVRRRNGTLAYRMNTLTGRRRAGVLRDVSGLSALVPSRSHYLVQRGILMARTSGRRFDVRALVQRDADGEWHLTGAAARVAGRGCVTTHVPRGGSRRRLEPVLLEIFGERKTADILKTLEHACIQAAYGLESGSGKRFGELSLDVAIDIEGHPWILELNAKPFRFDEPDLRQQAQRRLVRLASHFAGCRPLPIEEGASGAPQGEAASL